MKALILAAGRGERMRPLTDTTPKPLLAVGGKPLIVWQIERLVAGGFDELVVNHAWLGDRFEAELGDGSRFGASIAYSREGEALETLGGVVFALPLLTTSTKSMTAAAPAEPFAVVSADIYTDYDYAQLAPQVDAIARSYPARVAHFVLTDNPSFHPNGDMALVDGCISREPSAERLTYANIAVFHPQLFGALERGVKLPLFPWAYQFLDGSRISGEHYSGVWENVGTPRQLAELDERLSHLQKVEGSERPKPVRL